MVEHMDRTVLELVDRTVKSVVSKLQASGRAVDEVEVRRLRGLLYPVIRAAYTTDVPLNRELASLFRFIQMFIGNIPEDARKVIIHEVSEARRIRREKKKRAQEKLQKALQALSLSLLEDDEGFPPPPRRRLRPQMRRDPIAEFFAVFDL